MFFKLIKLNHFSIKLKVKYFKNVPEDAQDLIKKLLLRNPKKRLGAGLPGLY